MIPIIQKQSIKDKFTKRPRFYTGITVFTALLVFSGVYGFYNTKAVELEIDVSTGHSSNEQVTLHLEHTESHSVTPYTATYTAFHGCDWIVAGNDAKIEDCRIELFDEKTG